MADVKSAWRVATIHETENTGEPGFFRVRFDKPPKCWAVRRQTYRDDSSRVTEFYADVYSGPEDAHAVARALAARYGETVEDS